MKFTPKSESELSSFDVWPAGIYGFEVAAASDETSKAGNDMIKLTLHAFNRAGDRITVFDYLVNSDGGAYKVRHCAESCGLLEKYDGGQLDASDFVGRSGSFKLGIQPAQGQYSEKNTVRDYIRQAGTAQSNGTAKPKVDALEAALDDEIPF
jgi:hypothetical protein